MQLIPALTDIVILIPTVLITINEALKRVFNMDSKFSIVVDLIGGIALYTCLVTPYPIDLKGWLISGISGFLIGASAAGLYDFGKTTLETKFFTK